MDPTLLAIIALVLGLALGYFLGHRFGSAPAKAWEARHGERDAEAKDLDEKFRRAIVELAVLSLEPWRPERYDAALDAYLADRYPGVDLRVDEREYGVIPMTDAPLWRESTPRIWAIGTRGGWIQPSSGYAFARMARFAHEVAHALSRPTPRPWRPSPVQQIFNATMLRYVNERPGQAGRVFFDLFARNGAPRTFRFLDEDASLGETLALMWNSPRLPFAGLAVRETAARVTGMRG